MHFPRGWLAVLTASFLVVGLRSEARAQALKRFEDAHRSAPSETSSPSSRGSSSRSSSPGSAVVADVFASLFDAMFSSGGSPGDSGPSRRSTSYAPAAVVYSGSREAAYVRPFRLEEDGTWARTGHAARFGELKVGAFSAVGERVLGHDLAAAGWIDLFLVQGAWDRFYEPRMDVRATDTLDMFRLHLGPNVLGSSVKPVELYVLVGGSALRSVEAVTPAFDASVQMRVYPVRPFAFYTSMTGSFFEKGPPLLDARFEAGTSVGRFDFRVGIRGLRQEPAQSFLGPVASITVRL